MADEEHYVSSRPHAPPTIAERRHFRGHWPLETSRFSAGHHYPMDNGTNIYRRTLRRLPSSREREPSGTFDDRPLEEKPTTETLRPENIVLTGPKQVLLQGH